MTMKTKDEKQDIIKEALYASQYGKPCGCWKRDCDYGCGLTIEAIELWNDVKKTLRWLSKRVVDDERRYIITDLLKRLEQ